MTIETGAKEPFKFSWSRSNVNVNNSNLNKQNTLVYKKMVEIRDGMSNKVYG